MIGPGVASAQPTKGAPAAPGEDAYSHYERGLKFFEDGDYVASMVQFKRAYELDPNYAVLYNIGQTARELRLYSQALSALERYLKEGGSQVEPDKRARIEKWVAELREKVAIVTLKTNIAGVDIAVDDVEVGRTPLDKPVPMDAGKRKITAAKAGYAPLTRFIEVAGTEQKTIDLELVSLTGSGGGGGGPDNEVKHTPWPWVGLGVTGAFGIATAVMGGLTFAKKSDFEDALNAFPTTADAIEEARSTAKTFATAADVLGGVTGGFAALTVIAFIVDYTRKPKPSADSAAKTSLVEPVVAPGFIGLRGAF